MDVKKAAMNQFAKQGVGRVKESLGIDSQGNNVQ
jgi:hypothetical protein